MTIKHKPKTKAVDQDGEYSLLCNDLREVLKTTQGRNVVWSILSMCGIYTNTFTGNSQSYYLDGKRSVGLEILQVLEDTDPTAYARLLLSKQKEKMQ